jgi:hypothetical protein
MMRRKVAVIALGLLAVTSCGQSAGPRSGSTQPSPTPSGHTDIPTQAQIYAAVIQRLVTKDHTFGTAPSPFRYVYVLDGPIPDAANPRNGLEPAVEGFPEALKRQVVDRLAGLPPLEFISNPDSVRLGKQGLEGVRNDGVVLSLGPIEPVQSKVHVSTGLWCGGLCGQWQTYVLSHEDDRWRLTGTTGPYAIS